MEIDNFFILCQELWETTGNSTQLDEDFINLLYYRLTKDSWLK